MNNLTNIYLPWIWHSSFQCKTIMFSFPFKTNVTKLFYWQNSDWHCIFWSRFRKVLITLPVIIVFKYSSCTKDHYLMTKLFWFQQACTKYYFLEPVFGGIVMFKKIEQNVWGLISSCCAIWTNFVWSLLTSVDLHLNISY